jgi:hypothetical protein
MVVFGRDSAFRASHGVAAIVAAINKVVIIGREKPPVW